MCETRNSSLLKKFRFRLFCVFLLVILADSVDVRAAFFQLDEGGSESLLTWELTTDCNGTIDTNLLESGELCLDGLIDDVNLGSDRVEFSFNGSCPTEGGNPFTGIGTGVACSFEAINYFIENGCDFSGTIDLNQTLRYRILPYGEDEEIGMPVQVTGRQNLVENFRRELGNATYTVTSNSEIRVGNKRYGPHVLTIHGPGDSSSYITKYINATARIGDTVSLIYSISITFELLCQDRWWYASGGGVGGLVLDRIPAVTPKSLYLEGMVVNQCFQDTTLIETKPFVVQVILQEEEGIAIDARIKLDILRL